MGLKARPTVASRSLAGERESLKAFALGLPGAFEDHPWGESVAKVRGKVFVFFGRASDDDLHFSVKLPESGAQLLSMPFATPTGYGLGKSGWVSVRCAPPQRLPMELMRSFVVESYRAIAPKRLVAQLDL